MLVISVRDGEERLLIEVGGEPVLITVRALLRGHADAGVAAAREHRVTREGLLTDQQRALVRERLGVSLPPA